MTGPAGRTDHYSYSLYADPAIAEAFDARRFGGPIGRLIATTQETVLVRSLEPLAGRTILDVGTGTGRAAIALARHGAIVTGVDASAEMLAVAVRRAETAEVLVTFAQGDAHRLACDDRAFDSVVCLRVLMHTPDWRQSLNELCRAAREVVVFDYPAIRSAAAIQAALRHVLHSAGVRTEPYRVFSDRSVRTALAGAGFRVRSVHRQFVLPIAIHKAIGSVAFTTKVEGIFAAVGLRRLLGSPVTVVAERCAY